MERHSSMPRSIPIGVMLAGVLVGCSVGGGESRAVRAAHPTGDQLAHRVRRMPTADAGTFTDVRCTVAGPDVRCAGALVQGAGGAVFLDGVRFRLEREGDGWAVKPVCRSGTFSPFCPR
jgi:hypothetical protein